MLILSINCVFCSTKASIYAETQFANQNSAKRVHIIVKKEFTLDSSQCIGKQTISAITYGYGDLKIKGCKKHKITYICLLNNKYNPILSYIIPND